MTSLCLDTRGLNRKQDLLFTDYLEQVAHDPNRVRLVRGAPAGPTDRTTRWEPGSLLNNWWEKKFLSAEEYSSFHCFRPPSHVPWEHPQALVTLIAGPLPASLNGPKRCRLVVPSQLDRGRVLKQLGVEPEFVSVVSPPLRQEFQRSVPKEKAGERGVLFVTSASTDRKILKLLRRQHERLVQFDLDLSEEGPLSIEAWERLIAKVELAFYLVDDPCDWGTLAMECAVRGVPVVYSDGNGYLKENWEPKAHLGLRHYLLEHPSAGTLREELKKLSPPSTASLEDLFRPLYREAPVNLRPDLRPGPSQDAPHSQTAPPSEPGVESTDCSV